VEFTLKIYQKLLDTLLANDYSFQSFADYLENPKSRTIILRHDVDARPQNSLQFAQIQHIYDIRSSYYFRIVPKSFDKDIILKIAALGHEIGYHYEDMDLASSKFKVQSSKFKEEDLYDTAIQLFDKNLEKLRELSPVRTICMHGSPLSPFDNKAIWKKYNYHDYGIIGEPYFDIDFSRVFYLTDTGRMWDGEKVSLRDKVGGERSAVSGQRSANDKLFPVTRNPKLSFHSTTDIINAANLGQLPDQIMMTFHPQRWTDKPLPWMQELVMQNVKNVVKRIMLNVEG
jgi:hypothetical protein